MCACVCDRERRREGKKEGRKVADTEAHKVSLNRVFQPSQRPLAQGTSFWLGKYRGPGSEGPLPSHHHSSHRAGCASIHVTVYRSALTLFPRYLRASSHFLPTHQRSDRAGDADRQVARDQGPQESPTAGALRSPRSFRQCCRDPQNRP